MKRNFIIIFWALSMVILVACTNENDSEVDYNNTSVSEEGTYETITSQKNTESQEETEEIQVTETETEENSTALPDIKFTPGVEEAMSVPDEGLSLMQKVLLNKAEFWGSQKTLIMTNQWKNMSWMIIFYSVIIVGRIMISILSIWTKMEKWKCA